MDSLHISNSNQAENLNFDAQANAQALASELQSYCWGGESCQPSIVSPPLYNLEETLCTPNPHYFQQTMVQRFFLDSLNGVLQRCCACPEEQAQLDSYVLGNNQFGSFESNFAPPATLNYDGATTNEADFSKNRMDSESVLKIAPYAENSSGFTGGCGRKGKAQKKYQRIFDDSSLENGPKLRKSSDVDYSTRKDVIFKTMFRYLRRYYIDDFKTFFDFTKCKKTQNSENSGTLVTQLKKYVEARFSKENVSGFVKIMLYIIDYKQKYHTSSRETRGEMEKVKNLLLSFKKRRLPTLFESQEFMRLTIDYLSLPDIVTRLLRERKGSKLKRMYHKHLSSLKRDCEKNLSLQLNSF